MQAFFGFFLGKERGVILGRAGNWRSSLGLAYPHFHEDVSVSVPFVRQRLTSLKQKKQKSLCNLRNLVRQEAYIYQLVQIQPAN